MNIVVNEAYLDWRKANKNAQAATAIDNFLMRVFKASDSTQISPTPKAVGKNLRKTPGTVNEFNISKKYRVYSNYKELTPGITSFCLAGAGIKGVTDQHQDILDALAIFDDINATEWTQWQPTPEQIAANAVANEVPANDEPAPVAAKKQPATKKKGKPLDENGLTVAERKKLQREEEQKRQAAAKAKKAPRPATPTAQQPAAPVAEPAPAQQPAAPVVESAPVEQPAAPVIDTPVAPVNVATIAAPQSANIDPTPTVVQPTVVPGEKIEFTEFLRMQYQLKIIDHKMEIQELKILITQQKLELAEMKLEKQQLMLQMQQMRDMEK